MGGRTADVVVIGGAVMGASAAFWLTRMQPGLRVVVVERDTSFARASTALSVASIRMQFTTPVNVAISRFGIGFIRDFRASLGLDVGIGSLGFTENGYLFLTGSEDGAAILSEVAQMQRALGAATEILSPAALKQRFPWLETSDLVAGSFGPRDEGWFDNMGLLNGLRAAAKAQGAEFLRDTVTGLAVEAGRVRAVQLASGERIACGAAIR